MARRVWVLPPSWPSDPDGNDGVPEGPHEDTEQRRGLLRHRGKERAQAAGRSSKSEGTPPATEPDT
jgi:hypothetical protein